MRCQFLAALHVGREQVVCNRWAHVWLTRTLRIVQDIAAFIRIKSLPIFCSKDRARYIVFAARWADNAHAVNCRGDLLCVGSADGTVHLSAPLVGIWRGDTAWAEGRRGTSGQGGLIAIPSTCG